MNKYDYTKLSAVNQKEKIKKFLQWKIRISIRFYNWGYPVTKIIRWRINLSIRIHNASYPEEEPIPLLK